MKYLFMILLLAGTLSLSWAQTTSKQLQMESWEKVGKDSVKLFYGLSPLKITTMPVEEAKAFLTKTKLPVSKFFTAKMKAENYLLELKIKKDSLKVIEIYDRIEKKLGIKKSNGNSP